MNRDELKAQVDAEMLKLNPEATPETTEVVPETLEVSAEATDPVLEEAIKMGYNPNYEGPNKKTPEQFVRDGSFFRKIDTLKKQLDEQTQAMKLIVEHNKKKEEEAYNRGVQEAMMKRREAVELGDVEKFNEAEAQLRELQTKQQPLLQTPAPAPVTEVSPELKQFVEDNKAWFNQNTPENQKMVIEADGIYEIEKRFNPHLTDRELLEIVTTKIKALHPERFENPNKAKPAAVIGSSSLSSGKVPASVQLSERQRKIFEMAKAIDPSLKIEEYAKALNTDKK